MKKILVIGATGHLGGETVRHLRAEGYDVVAAGHRTSDNGFFRSIGVKYIGGFSLEDSAAYACFPQDIDAVVHLAGSMPAHTGNSVMPFVQSIVLGMANVCEWMLKAGIKRIVFNTTPSDFCEHFGTAKPVPEDAPRSFPRGGGDHAVYAISKNAAVDILSYYQDAFGFQPCVFRHMTVYGWHPNPYYYLDGVKKVLPYRQIIRNCMKGKPIEVWGDPKRKKELLYIKDFTGAVSAAIRSGACGLFNLPGVRPYTLEEQIDGMISGFAPPNCRIEKIYLPDKPDSPQNLLLLGGAEDKMGWLPRWDWQHACRDMHEEMMKQPFRSLWGENDPADSYC